MDKSKLVEVGGNTTFGAAVFSLTLNDLVAIITIIYLLIQIFISYPAFHERVRNFLSRFKHQKPNDQ